MVNPFIPDKGKLYFTWGTKKQAIPQKEKEKAKESIFGDRRHKGVLSSAHALSHLSTETKGPRRRNKNREVAQTWGRGTFAKTPNQPAITMEASASTFSCFQGPLLNSFSRRDTS